MLQKIEEAIVQGNVVNEKERIREGRKDAIYYKKAVIASFF